MSRSYFSSQWRPTKEMRRIEKGRLKSVVKRELKKFCDNNDHEVIVDHNYRHKHSCWWNYN